VSTALDAGATVEEVVGVLIALAPIVGVSRVNRAAADVAVALGIEIDVPGRE
jgi:alkylhydroperoxidase/carboxymuconolactone decarboxylase family protein YurZ